MVLPATVTETLLGLFVPPIAIDPPGPLLTVVAIAVEGAASMSSAANGSQRRRLVATTRK